MCLNAFPIGGLGRWNWDGDAVVFDTTVPSHRAVVGGRKHYQIDVRALVLTDKNAVIRQTLKEQVRPYARTLKREGDSLFEARELGAFDFRAAVIERWVGEQIKYRGKQGADPWQFPEETLTLRSGDCEDLAFLIASLLLGSGISGYHVRVALGEVRVGERRRFDHAWVVYKNEFGQWRIIEPLRPLATSSPGKGAKARAGARTAALLVPEAVRYVPSFLFNDQHLWIVVRKGSPGSVEQVAKRTWKRMNPKFAGDVHLSILERALVGAPAEFMRKLRGKFTRLALVGPVIDAPDWVNVLNPSSTPYDPRQHFDNGLISESWDLLENNAARFRKHRDDVDAFSSAAHAIADFYAHSSYLDFAWGSASAEPRAKIFHPDSWNDDDHLHDLPDYGPNPDPELSRFDLHRFSKNKALWKKSAEAAIETWNGRVLSGRYAQGSRDRMGSVTSKLAESMSQLPSRFVRPELGALPHHSEIAVDEADWQSSHKLYEAGAFTQQFRLRFNTAVEHVRKLYQSGVP
jgi:hypothetical protein